MESQSLQPQPWFDLPMRWAQLTLVENDPGNFDPQFWLDYIKQTYSQGVCLSAGGCVAYYPTRIPLHYRSAWMGDTDPFGELVAGCRQLGLVILARTDPHAVRQDVLDAHPDWISEDADGKKRPHWSAPGYWLTCPFGPHRFDFMTRVHAEIMTLYPVDGIFCNRWSGEGVCYCPRCRQQFKAASGFDIPLEVGDGSPAWLAYQDWRQQRLFDLWDVWDAEIRRLNPNARFIPNAGGGALSDLDMSRIGKKADILFSDRQARSGNLPPWANGKTAKEYRAVMDRKPVGGIFSVGLEESYRWKDSVQSEAEIRIWAVEGIANGMRPWFTKFSGVLYDRRWLPVVKELYQWHHLVEPYLRNEEPLAEVGVVYSQRSAAYYGEQAPARLESALLGVYQALIEARIPFELVHADRLQIEVLRRFKTVILPNIVCLSASQCDQLRAYVSQGGGLVATLETARCDENGHPRADFGLADLFQASVSGEVVGPVRNAYLEVHPSSSQSALLQDLMDAGRIIHGVFHQPVSALNPLPDPPLTVIPAYPDLPMEQVYPRILHTTDPGIFLAAYGAGRVVYFPWDIDRTFWEVLNPDHFTLFRNAVQWAAAGLDLVKVEGPGVLDVTLWRQQQSLTLFLVNLTNPMLMRRPFREFIALGQQHVELQLPAGIQVRRVRPMRSSHVTDVVIGEDRVSFNVSSITDFEMIAMDTV